MIQSRSCKITLIFLSFSFLSFMYYTSYSFNDIISGGRKFKKHIFKNSSDEDQENRIIPINVIYNVKLLRNRIVCEKNISYGNTNMSALPAKNHLKNVTQVDYFQNYGAEKIELCPKLPPHLGPVPADKSIVGLYGIENMYIDIVVGGIHSPPACIARQNAAIIVPLLDTNKHIRKYLASFLYYMHPFLMKQQLAYQMFVICKLNATKPYKRGELYNIGFEVAQTKRPDWDCMIFHDPYVVPEDTRNMYRCTGRPRRLIADGRMPPRFGKAVAIRPEVFIKINGFSNLAWNEDDEYIDIYRRLVAANISLETNLLPIGKYSSLPYLKQLNDKTVKRKQTTPSLKQETDGLKNVKLTIESIKYEPLYTLVNVVD